MTDPLQTLEADLTILASRTGQPTAALTGAQDVLALLAETSLVGQTTGGAVQSAYKAVASAINTDVVATLQAIAGTLSALSLPASTSVSDVAAALSALQNALQAAQGLVPGGSAATASAFAATSQFATLFGNLLSAPNITTLADAAGTLNVIALQLGAIASAFTNAAG